MSSEITNRPCPCDGAVANRLNHSLKKQIENDLHDVFHNVLMRSTNRHKVQVRILPPKIEGAVTDIKDFIWDQVEEENY